MYLWIAFNTEKWNEINARAVMLGFSEQKILTVFYHIVQKDTLATLLFFSQTKMAVSHSPMFEHTNIRHMLQRVNATNIVKHPALN